MRQQHSRRAPLFAALALAAAAASCSGSPASSEAPGDVTVVVGRDAGRDLGSAGGRDDVPDTRVALPDAGDPGSKPDASAANERFGRVCEEHADCEGGWCIEGPDGSVCTTECVDTCPEGWGCKGVSLFGSEEQISVCVPKTADVCRSCKGPSDCGGVPLCALGAEATGEEEEGTCLLACVGLGSACPGGFACQSRVLLPGAEPGWVCAPAGGLSCCASSNEGFEAECVRENVHGACGGKRVCEGERGWTPCLAAMPAAEVCDGEDNDCDGESDEGLGATCSCGDGSCVAEVGESALTCPADCAAAGDGVCSPGENPAEVPEDCCRGAEAGAGCGDGVCLGYGCGENPESCPDDCGTACGDGTCDKGESPAACPADCVREVCGNQVCEPNDGGPEECPGDCAAACGNCICEGTEGFQSCPIDCGSCGDGVCSACPALGETPARCPADCVGLVGEELCNGVDDDGDGETDEERAGGVGLCDDGDPCTEDKCAGEAGCAHGPAEDFSTCDDGEVCTISDACVGGVCVGEVKEGCCHSDADCPDDGDLCNGTPACDKSDANPAKWRCFTPEDSVVECEGLEAGACEKVECAPETGLCAVLPVEDGSGCDDGDECVLGESCAGGVCAGGEGRDCDDGSPCTVDSCDPGSGCVHDSMALDSTPCDDGDPCTVDTTCSEGACAGGAADPCDDDNPCTSDTCRRESGCTHDEASMNGEPCDDGKVCTEGSRCTGGACVGGTDPCDDGDPCTRDSCSEAEGCAHERAAPPCGDGVCSDSCGEDAAACFEDCGPKPEGFVLVPHGELLMGSPDEEPGRHGDEGPQRLVKITRGFWMKATEVTQGEWKALVGADKNPSKYPSCGEDCALDRVNWWEALAYCNALSVREELPECYSLTGCDEKAPGEGMECAGVTVSAEGENPVLCEGYRLPTEAEWEHAARAGSSSVGFDGPLTVDPGSCELDAALDAVAWYCGNSEVSYEGAGDCSSAGGTASCGPHPVGEKQPNGWGLHDMLGNQSEWVWDTYDAGYYEGRPDPDADPTGPAPGDERVVRGGAWGSVAGSCRAASRKPASPGLRDRFRGFRPVRTGEPLLVVTPAEELDFGTVGEGQRVERVVKLANAGAAPLDVHELRIEDDASDELRFGLLEGWPYLGQALSVAVSEEIEVGIVFENKVGPAGSAQATLRVVSDATPSPGYPLLLSARRAPGPECDARLAPSRLDFGTIPFGTVRDMGFTLTNVGTGDCEILGLDDADRLRVDDCSLGFPGFPNPFGTCIRGEGAGSQSSLRFGVLEPPAPATVEPGKSVTISVRYTAPAGPGLFTGVEGLDTNNALLSMKLRDTHRNEDVWVPAAAANAASPGQANLQARAAAAEVAAIPHEVEFGATTPGCSSRAVTVKLYNKGAAPLSVSGIKLGEDCTGEIELVSTPSLPAELLRGSPLSVELRYVPTDPGRDLWCALEVRSNHPSSPELAIPISGRGSDGNAQVDSFTGLSGRHVDMLLVVDTSGSMTREQGELAAKVADLVVESVAWGNHYRIAVTTADVDEHEGRFFGSPRWVAPDTPDGLETLAASIAALPQSQGGIEQGFDAVHRALTPPHSSLPGDPPLPCADESACRAPYGCYADPEDYSAEPGSFCGGPNWGFLRRDAALEVVILSDEADQSAAGLDFYRDFFSELKGPREELLRVHAIVGTDGQTAQACGVDPDDADAGAGYVEIANETGGVLGSICEEDYGDTLRAISALVFGPKTRFVLSREARPGSVEVKVNGSACEAGWILDEPSSSVVFEEDHPCLPQAGDSVEISYEAICVPVE